MSSGYEIPGAGGGNSASGRRTVYAVRGAGRGGAAGWSSWAQAGAGQGRALAGATGRRGAAPESSGGGRRPSRDPASGAFWRAGGFVAAGRGGVVREIEVFFAGKRLFVKDVRGFAGWTGQVRGPPDKLRS
jgi:hypothetical protein